MDKIKVNESQAVGEFIETLKQFPQDLPIRINFMKGTEIWISEEFCDGNSANPNCPIFKAVIVV